jgi:hypothetical protein
MLSGATTAVSSISFTDSSCISSFLVPSEVRPMISWADKLARDAMVAGFDDSLLQYGMVMLPCSFAELVIDWKD